MPPRVSDRAAADAPALFSSEQRFIKEWVRFWFHGIAISLCGLLATLIPRLMTAEVFIPATLGVTVVLTLVIWGLWAGVISLVSSPPEEFEKRDQKLLTAVIVFSGIASAIVADALTWSMSETVGWYCGSVHVTGLLLGASLALFAWYEFLRCRPSWQKRMRTWIFWPLTSWMVWAANKIKVRPHEIGTRSSSLDFLAGLGIIWAACPSWVLATACFICAWADPFARVIGRRWGKTKWPFGSKTLAGSLTCFVIAATISYSVLHWSYGPDARIILCAFLVGLVTMSAELIPQWPKEPKPGDMLSPADNFWLILSSGFALHGAQLWLTP